jgi:acetyltransferase
MTTAWKPTGASDKLAARNPPFNTKTKTIVTLSPLEQQLTTRWQLPEGTDILIRPIRPDDVAIKQEFVRKLSPQTRFLRFMRPMAELTPDMLERFTRVDQTRDLALMAVTLQDGQEVQIGVGRYFAQPDRVRCEFAIVVADEWQGRGVGSRLLSLLIENARARGLKRMEGDVLAQNGRMLQFVHHFGFLLQPRPSESSYRVIKTL